MAKNIIGPDANGNYWEQYVDVSRGTGQESMMFRAAAAPIEAAPGFVGTYKVADALKLAQTMAKGVPFAGVDMTICDLVSAAVYKAYPWRDTLALTPNGAYPLVDGQQDYSLGTVTMFRPTQFWLKRNDVTPKQIQQIDVAKSLTADPAPKSPQAIRCASLQGGIMKLRLESAVRISVGTSWEIGAEYQPHPVRISDLQDPLWCADEHLEVIAKGLTYWAYKLADLSAAGDMTTDDAGRARYTGALAAWMKAIADMAAAEDFGNIDGYYPDESLGTVDGRVYNANPLFPSY